MFFVTFLFSLSFCFFFCLFLTFCFLSDWFRFYSVSLNFLTDSLKLLSHSWLFIGQNQKIFSVLLVYKFLPNWDNSCSRLTELTIRTYPTTTYPYLYKLYTRLPLQTHTRPYIALKSLILLGR